MNITDFNTRGDLETNVINTYGQTTDRKEDSIVGTKDELSKFKLRHGQQVWGVPVVATDYEPMVEKNKLSRGEVKSSVINGLIKIKNAINKDKVRE